MTDIGWFHELSDDIVIKVPLDVTAQALAEVLKQLWADTLDKRSQLGHKFVSEHCTPEVVAKEIVQGILDCG